MPIVPGKELDFANIGKVIDISMGCDGGESISLFVVDEVSFTHVTNDREKQ